MKCFEVKKPTNQKTLLKSNDLLWFPVQAKEQLYETKK